MRTFRDKIGLNNILMLIGSMSVILISIVFSYYRNHSSAKEVQYAYDLKNEIRQIESAVLKSESSQRGFMLTQNDDYLEPLTISKENYLFRMEKLKKLNNADESIEIKNKYLNSLDSLVLLKFLELEKTIRLTKSDNIDVGLQIVESNLGLQYMTSIYREIDNIEFQINDNLKRHKEDFDFWNFVSITLISLSGVILALSFYNLIVKISPIIHDLVKTTKSLEHANLELKDNVESLRLANIEKSRTVKKNRSLIKSLKGKNEQLDHFAYVASHDLQEPLRTVSNYVEIFQEDYEDKMDDDAEMYFRFINEALERMRNLISGLLNFSRLGTSGDLEKVDLNKRLSGIEDNFRANIEENDILIHYNNLPVLKAYKIEITQLFHNIISNAIKFKKPDIAPVINISFTEDATHYNFKITDNGIGIKKEHLHKIFDMFSRLHSAKEYEGQGIGLAFCKKIVEMHNGEIWVESTFGEGTTFNFTLQKDL